ncbi:hypothetical protein [Streptomyces rochei]|uniref:hypothetical protein n=1 Tax=Streptomyces rochei TaxID=1928 RepID=UPI0022E9B28A|nr:hypothetical protein [Streptomyces rochei]MCC8455411.1 hypothetical protein [Streptomyces rochei]
MPPRPLTLLLLVLLSVTGCTTVKPDPLPADRRPQGVRGPAVPARPAVATPTVPVAQPSGRSALVRIEPDRPRRTTKSDRAPARRTQAPEGRRSAAPPKRPTPRLRPAAPHHEPRERPRSTVRRHAPQKPPARPQPREQMRELCARADGFASSGVVGLCHQTWG